MFKKIYTNNKFFFWTILLVIILRIALFIIAKPWDPATINNRILAPNTDDITYHELAVQLLQTKSFDAIGSFRTPGYPVFIALIYAIFGIHPWLILVAQILLYLGLFILTYIITKKLFNKTAANICIGIYFFDPYTISFSSRLLSDTLFTFLFLSSIFLFIQAINNKKQISFIITGFMLGLATLVKPISQFFPIILIFILMLWPNLNKNLRLKSSINIFLFFILALSPWLVRNYNSYKNLSLSSITGVNLLYYNVAATIRNKNHISIDEAHNYIEKNLTKTMPKNISDFQASKIYTNISKKYILKNPRYYFIDHIRGCIKLFMNTKTFDYYRTITEVTQNTFKAPRMTDNFVTKIYSKAVIIIYLYLLLTYLSCLLGIYFLIKDKNYIYLFFFFMTLMYFINITGHVGYARYKLPIIPIYLMLSAYGISRIKKSN